MTVTLPLPFENSRTLAHGSPWPGGPCVALDVVGLELEAALYDGWRRRIERVAHALGWPAPCFEALAGQAPSTLRFTAPPDQLQTAREANEWALCAAVIARDPSHWGTLHESLEIDECTALARLRRLGAAEPDAVSPA